MSIRLDETGFGDIALYQDTEEFCYGVDAVMLSDFAAEDAARKGSSCRAMDLGTGTGIIPLILSHKTQASYIGGIEVQKNSYNLAVRNAETNNLTERLHFFHENVRDFQAGDMAGTFDLVTSNPPYMRNSCGISSSNPAKCIAREETEGSLDDFLKLASLLLKDKGEFCMVHRPSRLVDICEGCRRYRLEPKEMIFVSGKPMEKPNILLVRCIKNGNRELRVRENIYVHNEDGSYSAEILRMYGK